MGDSNSIMAPSRGMTRETASIKNVIRKTLPLKELPETKQSEIQHSHTVTNLSAPKHNRSPSFSAHQVSPLQGHWLCDSWLNFSGLSILADRTISLCTILQLCAILWSVILQIFFLLTKFQKKISKNWWTQNAMGKPGTAHNLLTPALRSLTREDLRVRPARTTSQDPDSEQEDRLATMRWT